MNQKIPKIRILLSLKLNIQFNVILVWPKLGLFTNTNMTRNSEILHEPDSVCNLIYYWDKIWKGLKNSKMIRLIQK